MAIRGVDTLGADWRPCLLRALPGPYTLDMTTPKALRRASAFDGDNIFPGAGGGAGATADEDAVGDADDDSAGFALSASGCTPREAKAKVAN